MMSVVVLMILTKGGSWIRRCSVGRPQLIPECIEMENQGTLTRIDGLYRSTGWLIQGVMRVACLEGAGTGVHLPVSL
jgi:hypothetical protein